MIKELIKECFIHFTLLDFKSDNMISFESRIFDTNEFGRLKLVTGDYDFIKDKSSMYSDFENLYKDNTIIKPNQKGLELLKVNFVFNSTFDYSKKNNKEVISKYFSDFIYHLDEAIFMLNDLLIEKGYDIKFTNPLSDLKPENCIHLKDKKKIEFLVKYSTFVFGNKTINRY
jgi:hypothetical protein